MTKSQKVRYTKLLQEFKDPHCRWFNNRRRLRSQLDVLLDTESINEILDRKSRERKRNK